MESSTDQPFNKPAHCLDCPLRDAPGPVFADPPQPNTLMFLGEAPGKDEILLDRNFIGGAGRVLRQWCQQTGLNITAAEVRNVVKCRPTIVNSFGREVDRAPTEAEMRHCSHFLKRELEVIRPNLIVALGVSALYVTTERTQIGQFRGRILEGPQLTHIEGETAGVQRRVKVLSVYHPAFVMRQQELWPLAVYDLAKAKHEKGFAEIKRHPVEYRTVGDLCHPAGDYLAAAVSRGYVVFDLEAEGIVKRKTGLDLRTGAITVMGLSSTPYTAEALHWTPDVIELCRRLFADSRVEKVGQNSEGFDIPYIEAKGLGFAGRSFDTLQAFHLTNSDMEKNLDFIASLYTDMESWKGPKMYKAGFDALKLGNCKDVDATHRAYLGLKSELTSLGMDHLYYNSVMPLQPVLRAMSTRGIKRDELATFKASLGVKKISAAIEQQIRNVVGQAINLDSPKQLSKLLYEDMGLPVQTKRDKKRGMVPTVDDNALDALERLTNNKLFTLINKRRKFNKLDSTYFSLEADEQGFIHPKFGSAKAADPREKEKGSGARNGRLVSWNPNFQNQPLDVRELYIPDHPDHVFIEADWSQVEWRAAMVDSGEPYGLEVLASGADNHSIVAAECFGLTLAQVAAEDAKYSGGWGSPRFASKFIIYGLGYGRGAPDIAKQLGKDVAWVQGFISRFKSRLPVYWKWRSDLESFVAKNNYLRNFIGRRRWWYTKQVTEMYNYPPSSTAADMMYLVLPQLERELPHGATLRLTVHDSVLINAPRDGIRQTVQCVRDVMQRTWPEIVDFSKRPENVKKWYPNGWYCPADVHLGTNWKECKKGNKALEKELLGA